MCVFHIYLETDQLDFILNSTNLPIYKAHKKGDTHKYLKDKVYDYNLISCVVSDKDWNDFEGQTDDMMDFLNKYHIELKSLKDNFKIDNWQFDVPYYCRLEAGMIVQNDFLPSRLLSLAGYFGIDINLSLYPMSEEDLTDKRKKK
jgi:hypothetical protein